MNSYSCSLDFDSLKKQNIKYILDNTKSNTHLPRRFKVSQELKSTDDLKSFKNLNIVASSQFSPSQFEAVVEYLKTKHNVDPSDIYVFDLREEPHFFINDSSISAAKIDNENDQYKFSIFEGLSYSLLVQMEQFYSESIFKKKSIVAHVLVDKKKQKKDRYKTLTVKIESVQIEKYLVEKFGAHYVRLLITDHKHPRPEFSEEFIEQIKALPSNAWVYFHCRGGVGRTSSFTLMLDILRNGKKLSLQKLIKRNLAFGNTDKLFDPTKVKSSKMKEAQERQKFLEDFYLKMTK